MPKQWYIIHTYSGFEERVRKTLEQRIDAIGMQEIFGEVLIPTETVVEMPTARRARSSASSSPATCWSEWR